MASCSVCSASGGAGRSEAPTERSMTCLPAARAWRLASSSNRNRPFSGVRLERNIAMQESERASYKVQTGSRCANTARRLILRRKLWLKKTLLLKLAVAIMCEADCVKSEK